MIFNLFQDGEKDTDKLKEHIRILQEENFSRIAQIADLQVEVNNLKVKHLYINVLP
jgi:3'-phosphoadenosine 5'-phosphosulfate sulfotransferase